MQTDEAASHDNSETRDQATAWVREMLLAVWSRWPVVVVTAFVFFLGAVYYLRTTPYTYTASLRVSSAQSSSQSGGFGALGNIAAMAGLGGGVSGDAATPFKLYLEGLTSREVATRLSRDPEIMQTLFAGQWDATSKRWRQPESALRGVKNAVFGMLGLPVFAWTPPGPAELQDLLASNIMIDQNTKTPLVTLSMNSADPKFAMALLTKLHETDDRFVREQARARTESNIAYLNSKIETTTLAENRKVLFDSIAEQGQQMMLVNASAPYAAEPFGPAIASLHPTSPRPIPVLISTTIAGVVAGLVLALLLGRRAKRAA